MRNITVLSLLSMATFFCGCTAFDVQCDSLTDLDAQVECLDTAFLELRSSADACYDEQRDRGEAGREECVEGETLDRGGVLYTCTRGTWISEGEADPEAERVGDEGLGADRDGERAEDEDADARDREDIRSYCAELSEGDEDYERCRGAMDELEGLHQRTRGEVERNGEARERRGIIRNGLREGRGLADCRRHRADRERGERPAE